MTGEKSAQAWVHVSAVTHGQVDIKFLIKCRLKSSAEFAHRKNGPSNVKKCTQPSRRIYTKIAKFSVRFHKKNVRGKKRRKKCHMCNHRNRSFFY